MSPDGNTVAVGIVQYSSNLGRVAVYKYSGSSWGSVVNIDTTVGTGTYQIGNTPVFNNDGTLLVTGCSAYNSYMGCFEMWKYESGSWVFKKQFLNPTVKTGHGSDTGEFFGAYLSMDHTGTSVIVSNPGNDVQGADYGRVVLYGAGSSPSLTFDGYNKLTAPVLDASFTATRLSDWDSSNSGKTVVANSGDWPETTAGITEHNVLQNGDKSYQKTNGGSSRDSAQLFDTISSGWANASHGASGTHSPMTWGYKFTTGAKKVGQMILTQPPNTHPAGNVTIKYWDGSAMVTVSNQSPTGMTSEVDLSSTEFTFDIVSAQYWQIDCYRHSTHNGTTYTGLSEWQLYSGRDPVTTVLTKGSDSWDVGTASSIYIDAAGTYDAQAKNSNTFVIKTSKQLINTPAPKQDYTNIWAGEYSGMVIDSDGKLYTWGDNGNNESGRGASDRTPTHISTISDPVSNVWVEGARGRTRLVKTSTDKWYMWGMNSSLNKIFGETADQATPVDVTSDFTTHFGAQGTSDTTRIVKVVMSASACSALAADGKVWSWGTASSLFGSVGHALPGNGSTNYYECVSVSGTTYLYKRPSKPSNHGSEIKFVADSTTGSGRYTGTWQDASSVNYPNAFQDPSLHPTTSGTPSYTPTHNDTTLYLYNNENHDATCTVDYTSVVPAPVKNTTDGSTELSNITDIRSLDSGKLALDSNGDVWQWGTLRTGSTVYATKQTGLDSITIIGIGSSFFTAYAWDTTGTIYSIGQGTEGQLGNGASSDQDSTWQTVTTLQGKTIYGIYGAGYSVFAHTSDGIYACGQGANGRLGMGDNNNLNVFTKSTTLSALSIYKLDFGHGPGYIITTDGKGYALGLDSNNSIPTPLSGDKNVPTEASSLTNLSLAPSPPPAITYDNSNKLSLTGVTTPSSNLTVGTNTYDIGSAKVVFIKDQGTYKFHTNDGDQALILSNVVSSTPSGTTYLYNVYSNPSTRVSNYSTANTSKSQVSGNGTWPVSSFMATHNVLNNGDKAYGKTDGGSSRDPAQLFDTISSAWGEASHGTNGTHSPMSWGYEFTSGAKMINKMILYQPPSSHPAGNVTIKYWDGTSMTTVSNQSPIGMTSEVDLSSTEFTFDAVSSQYWQIDCYRHSTQTTGYTGLSEWEIYSAATSLTLSGTTPSQVYDNTKTITVSNIPSTQTGINGKFYKGATAYTIHATEPTSNVIIKNTGSYVSVFTTSNIAYFTNTVNVNATPTTTSDDNTIEDEALDVTTTTSVSKTIAFHDGLFADSDDPHGDGSITAAAIAGHVYSDTAPGTYTWGTLTSCVRTAMANNLYSDENFGYNNGTPPTAGFTTYKWTPPGTITNGRTLVVAGGGGGGTDMGGGGGAGGLLASTTTNIAHAEQTIQVGSGGARGYGPGNSNDHGGGDGGDSSISGPGITSIGGGGGGTAHTNNGREFGRDGGSGGGTSGYYQNGNHGPRGYGTSGQGNDGGLTTASYYSSGGGGAGEVGVSGGSGVPGDGGDGLEDDILGTSYWWAGGGGANAYNSQGSGHGGKGGGGGGAATHTGHSSNWRVGLGNTNGITNGGDGENPGGNWNTATGGSGGKHTGGGGGGGQHNTGGVTTMRGGRGGSGIVAIKFTAQKTVIVTGIPGSTAVADPEPVADAPSVTLVATTEVATPTMNLDFTANMSTFPRTLKRYNGITNSSIGARFNRTESKKKRVQKSINTDTFSIELTANNMGDSSSSSSTLPVTVVNSGAGTQYTSGWTTGTTSAFAGSQ